MLRKLLLCLILVEVSFLVDAQSKRAHVDSLLNYLEDDPSVKVDDFELINEVCSEAEEISGSIDYAEGLFRSKLIRVQVYRDFSEEKFASTIKELEVTLEENGDEVSGEYVVEYYLVRGYISGRKGLFLDELNYYLKADSLCKTAPPGFDLNMYVQQHLAVYYFTQKDYKKARVIFEKIIAEQEELEIPNPPAYALYLFNLGVINKHLGNSFEARRSMKKGIELGSADYKDGLYQYCMLAESYLESDYPDSAAVWLQKATELKTDQTEASTDWVEYYLVNSKFYFEKQDHRNAASYADQAIELSDSLEYITGSIDGLEMRVRNILATGGRATGTEDFETLIQLKDSLSSRSSLEIEKKYLVEYRTLEKEALAKQKQAENDQLQLENEFYQRSLILYGLLALALILILILAVRRFRTRKKLVQRELEFSELEKASIQNELLQREKELESKINLLQENTRKLNELRSASQKAESVQQIMELFDKNYIEESQWDNIILQFESIHPEFVHELRSSEQEFTRNDIKIAILDKLNYSNQSMQEILNISYEGVKKAKQRFRKKMDN